MARKKRKKKQLLEIPENNTVTKYAGARPSKPLKGFHESPDEYAKRVIKEYKNKVKKEKIDPS